MAKIKLNNNEYLISDSTLATPTADFIAHLGTVAGNGLKVVVGGVEYSIDSGKMSATIAALETVFGNLSGGAGGGSWKGTPVIGTWDGVSERPSEIQVEKIYFNTEMSVEEVVNILSTLQYENMGDMEIIVVCGGLDMNGNHSCIPSIRKSNGEYEISDQATGTIAFVSSKEVFGLGFTGWNPDFAGCVEVNGYLSSPGAAFIGGLHFDNQQELYSSLISLTPFEKVTGASKELSGTYDD